MKLAKFDIFDVEPISYVKLCYMPGIVLHGINDNLVPIKHSYSIFASMNGDKCMLELGGGHNSWRPPHILERVHSIIREIMLIPKKDLDEAMLTRKVPPPSFSSRIII